MAVAGRLGLDNFVVARSQIAKEIAAVSSGGGCSHNDAGTVVQCQCNAGQSRAACTRAGAATRATAASAAAATDPDIHETG